MKQMIQGYAASLAFIAVGVFMRWAEAPAAIVWFSIIFGAFGLAAVTYRVFRPFPRNEADSGESAGLVLRDGRDYRVEVTDAGFTLTHKTTSESQAITWSEVSFVAIIAIDNFPVGGISFLVHRAATTAIEVPWDAEGGREFMNAMQEKLPGFDNVAVVESSSMLHGFRQVWPPETTKAPRLPG